VKALRQVLIGMVEKLAHSLRESGKLTACITVKIRYSNFDTETRQVRIPYTACDHTLIRHALGLFDRLYQRRMLVRLAGVRLSSLVNGGYQISLFDDTPEEVNLYQAMDRIKRKFGTDKVMRASGISRG
jgi:DNA polymerase IV